LKSDHKSHEGEIAYFSGLAKEGLPEGQFNNGAIVVATDYEGLGTPGTHTYLVGRSEGANVLDAIRAARQVTGTEGQSITIGHSQGGGAALWAAQMAPEYATDVNLVGAVAAAPATEQRQAHPGQAEHEHRRQGQDEEEQIEPGDEGAGDRVGAEPQDGAHPLEDVGVG
jgi:pimeloyl-ACP methyl ester carboxylesterase